MLGAVCGDIIGSIYEVDNIKTKKFELFSPLDSFTDDTVMTCAIAEASFNYLKTKDLNSFRDDCVFYMQKFGRANINAGYGGTFIRWLVSPNPLPYNSYGNGSAMRVSSVAYVAKSLEEAKKLARISASVSHNHPEGIKGAECVASAIWLAKNGASRENIRKYIEDNYYKLNFTIDKIRDNYKFDVSCQGSVPQAIVAFLESTCFEDAIRNAVSIGGDSDTIAAICGSIAEAYYGIPQNIVNNAVQYLDETLRETLIKFYGENFYSKSLIK